MNLDDEKKAFHYAVYDTVSRIPHGNVTTYGHIAYLIGRPQNSRQVGSSLKHLRYIRERLNQEGAGLGEVPWWRVVNSAGIISPRNFGEFEQATLLRGEGVVVLERHKMDLEQYGWFPDDVE
uniref:6-O-methylguanine-DNA methyltransferase n=1 Tax=Candidozyma auris TaxID=498019 RepID=A0A0L0NRF6_CANAR